jgi:hypothetical protein
MTLKLSKQIFFALLLSLPMLTAFAAANPVSIQLIDRIPLEIETVCYQETLDSNKRIVVLSPYCKLWILGAGSHMANTVFHYNEPMPLADRTRVEYRIILNADSGSWKPVFIRDTVIKNRVFLGDVQLKPGQRCKLEFRNAGEIIQSQVIQRGLLVPLYKSFRQHQGAHTSEEALFSKSLQESSASNKDSDLPGSNVLLLKPGQPTDILLASQGLNVDSSLEYSFEPLEQSNANAWITTGTVLHLNALPGDANYVLQVRYNGMPASLSFFVASKPYWYQHLLFRLLLGLLIAGILLGVPWYYYRYRSKKEAGLRRRLESQLQLVHNQLNPHFIFNSLGSITGL